MGEKLDIDEIIIVDKSEGKAKVKTNKKKDVSLEIKEKSPKKDIAKEIEKAKEKSRKGKPKVVFTASERKASKVTESRKKSDKTVKEVRDEIREADRVEPSQKTLLERDNTVNLIEAALFMSPRPLSLSEIAKIASVQSLGYVKEILEKLKLEYAQKGIEISCENSSWQMHVRPKYLSSVSNLAPHTELSEGCRRSLALIAYKEPLPQSELIKIQGNKAYTYVKELEKKGLVKALKKGHTKLLKLTKEFERYFGEEKKVIQEQLSSFASGSEPV